MCCPLSHVCPSVGCSKWHPKNELTLKTSRKQVNNNNFLRATSKLIRFIMQYPGKQTEINQEGGCIWWDDICWCGLSREMSKIIEGLSSHETWIWAARLVWWAHSLASSPPPPRLFYLEVSEAVLENMQLKLWFETSPFLTKWSHRAALVKSLWGDFAALGCLSWAWCDPATHLLFPLQNRPAFRWHGAHCPGQSQAALFHRQRWADVQIYLEFFKDIKTPHSWWFQGEISRYFVCTLVK